LKTDGEFIAVINERIIMHLLLTPVLASMIWVGGGGAGLLLVIVVVVLLLRR
jgi:cellobiose-specific phosphotransferase system component IIC